MSKIHPTAIVDSSAQVDSTVEIDAYSIIGPDVQLGPNCKIDAHVSIKGKTKIGKENHFRHACLIGEMPQKIDFAIDKGSQLTIGDHNTFQGFSQVRASSLALGTKLGNHNCIMGGALVGHDCILGDHIVLGEGSVLGGHAHLEDYVNIAAVSAVHQYVKIGSCASVSMNSTVLQDIPPFALSQGQPVKIHGLNLSGLKKAEISIESQNAIYRAFSIFFVQKHEKNQSLTLSSRLDSVRNQVLKELPVDTDTYTRVSNWIDFIEKSQRGIAVHHHDLHKWGLSEGSDKC